METKMEIATAKKHFIKQVVAVDVRIIIIAGIASVILKFDSAMILLISGILVGGIGVILGRPNINDPKNPRNLSFKYRNRPNELLSDQVSYNANHLLPSFAFENVMTWAGLVAILLSIPFLVYTIF